MITSSPTGPPPVSSGAPAPGAAPATGPARAGGIAAGLPAPARTRLRNGELRRQVAHCSRLNAVLSCGNAGSKDAVCAALSWAKPFV